jgi:hypothetical protein
VTSMRMLARVLATKAKRSSLASNAHVRRDAVGAREANSGKGSRTNAGYRT